MMEPWESYDCDADEADAENQKIMLILAWQKRRVLRLMWFGSNDVVGDVGCRRACSCLGMARLVM